MSSTLPSRPASLAGFLVLCGLILPVPQARAQAASAAPDDAASPDQLERQARSAVAELVAQAMDQPTDLDLKEAVIGDALQQLSDNTGVPIETAPRTIGVLPYGSKTTLTAKIEGRPLREVLTALLTPLGLTFTAEDGKVVVQPRMALRRLCDRATWKELGTLEKLYSQPWSDELADALSIQFRYVPGGDYQANLKTLKKLAGAVGAGIAGDVLDAACEQYGWSWYPTGDEIVILPKARQIERQLEQRIFLRPTQVTSLNEALVDLAERVDILLKIDPGALAALPPQLTENFTLKIMNYSARQALEVIAGQTGLNYFIEPDGVRISFSGLGGAPAAQETAEATVRALRSNSFVGQVTYPLENGASYGFFLRDEDLPPEVQELRRIAIEKAVERMRADLGRQEKQ